MVCEVVSESDIMQIHEAVENLRKAVGIACDAEGNSHQPDESIGQAILGSEVSFVASKSIAERSIHSFNPHAPQEVIEGGTVLVKFIGDQQPEAARTLDSILTPIINRHAPVIDTETGEPMMQYRRRSGHTEQRSLKFTIPEHKAADFVDEIIEVTHKIQATQGLRSQFAMGTELSMESINKIRGAKPYLQLHLGKGFELDGDKPIIKPPYFKLKINGVPIPLAKELALIVGVEELPNSPETTSRDHKQRFNGGKTLTIALDDPKMPAVKDKIERYVALMRQFTSDSSSLPKH